MAARVKPYKLMDVPLVHESIAVVRRARMQQLYEHKVTVETPLQLALTFPARESGA